VRKKLRTGTLAFSTNIGGVLTRRTIQIEFNELSPTLLEEFIDAGELPNFRRLRDSCETFVTDASGEVTLEPWVQWPTLHTGIPDRDHGIQYLGQARLVRGRGLARELATAGFKVGVFGSMNLDYGPLNGFVMHDPWNAGSSPHPAGLRAFTDFVSSAVQENSTDRLDKRAAAAFVGYLATHGLTFNTAVTVARHLLDESRDRGLRWRRSLILDAIAYDVFRTLVRRHDVAYATFFSNSTAHLQHYFWRNFRPEGFSTPPPRDDHSSLADAILTGYRENDRLIGRLLSDFPEDRLIFVTALSQQAWDTTKCMHRPKNFDNLLQLLGIDTSRTAVEPVMAEEFYLAFADGAAADYAVERLSKSRIGAEPLFQLERKDALLVKVGCAVYNFLADDAIVELPDGTLVGFGELFYRIHGVRSGRHHPDGCFWVQSPNPREGMQKVPLTAVAPTILQLFDVDIPSYMREPPIALAELQQ